MRVMEKFTLVTRVWWDSFGCLDILCVDTARLKRCHLSVAQRIASSLMLSCVSLRKYLALFKYPRRMVGSYVTFLAGSAFMSHRSVPTLAAITVLAALTYGLRSFTGDGSLRECEHRAGSDFAVNAWL